MQNDKAHAPVNINLRWLFWLPAALAALFVAAALAALVAVSARSVDRMAPVQRHFDHIEQLHALSAKLQRALVSGLSNGQGVPAAQIEGLARQLRLAATDTDPGHAQVREKLVSLADRLTPATEPGLTSLSNVVTALDSVLAAERAAHYQLAYGVAKDARTELHLAIGLLIAMPLVIAVTLFLLRHRVKRPLDDVGRLLQTLADQNYQPVSERDVEESAILIQPVLRSYNHLVNRLSELEARHMAQERHLQDEVRAATSALLAQSGELARAEKLAALGELSAAMAHEIRNPLAGIQLACAKLARDAAPDQRERADMIVSELKRLGSLLRERVEDARHTPEPLADVSLAPLVEELLGLVRYQIPPDIALHSRVPPELVCRIPENGFRQALLNLVLNAAGAIDQAAGSITVLAERQQNKLLVEVLDDGPGFPSSMLGDASRPFVTGRPDGGGTGLGLAIVQRFVRNLGGELQLQNRAGGGARVSVLISCGPPADAAQPTQERTHA